MNISLLDVYYLASRLKRMFVWFIQPPSTPAPAAIDLIPKETPDVEWSPKVFHASRSFFFVQWLSLKFTNDGKTWHKNDFFFVHHHVFVAMINKYRRFYIKQHRTIYVSFSSDYT